MAKQTKRGIDEWNEAIDKIFNDDVLRNSFIDISNKTRSEITEWAKKHGFKHYIILRLAKEYSLFWHYEKMRTVFFRERHDKPSETPEFIKEKFLGAYILKQEVKNMFFITEE
ncbi:MAG: hypothetical protein Q4A15_04565 [Prevotellaceae bacterium]|nr:hypothetical protein [Prevotellaceae bacterium]